MTSTGTQNPSLTYMALTARAAQFAAESGTSVLITNAALVASALRGEDVGTWFEASAS